MSEWVQFGEGVHRTYHVNQEGGFKTVSKRTGKANTLNPCSLSGPYNVVKVHLLNGTKTMLVHRIMASAFIPNSDNKPTVNHIDGNKRNNTISNLEWSTKSEQNIHASRLGLKKFNGEDHSQNKLTEKEVIEIRYRTLYADIPEGKEYGVTNATITDVIRRRSWTHV